LKKPGGMKKNVREGRGGVQKQTQNKETIRIVNNSKETPDGPWGKKEKSAQKKKEKSAHIK